MMYSHVIYSDLIYIAYWYCAAPQCARFTTFDKTQKYFTESIRDNRFENNAKFVKTSTL